jgi:hypothetical protein
LSELKTRLGPRGERLEPELIEPRLKGLRRVHLGAAGLSGVPRAPASASRLAWSLLAGVVPVALSEGLALALSLPEEEVWAWSPEAHLGLSRESFRSA